MTSSNRSEKGALRSDQNQLIFGEGFSFSGYERDPVYLNLGNRKFMEVSGVSGLDSMSDGRGAVFADFDNDGDTDVFLTTLQGDSHLLFRNNVGQERNYLRVLLEGGPETGKNAYGSVVRVRTSAGTLTKVHAGGSGYLSQHDPRLLFGLGGDAEASGIEVIWPGGQVERFEKPVRAGSSVLLRQGSGVTQGLEVARAQLPDPLTRSQSLGRGLKVAVRQPFPDLRLAGLEGTSTTLYSLLRPGRRMVVNLWATWCAPCRYEMPELEKLRPRLAQRGVDLVGLNVDTDPEARIRLFLEKTGARYPSFVGGVAALEQIYGSEELTVPLSLVLNDQGVLEQIISGWSPESRRSFKVLAGEADPVAPGAGSTKR